MTDLIERLSAAEGQRGHEVWHELNDHAHHEEWIDEGRWSTNGSLIESALRHADDNVLIAVALSLVPEGTFWKVGHDGGGYAMCGDHSVVEHATPTIALAIAALHARAAVTRPDGAE